MKTISILSSLFLAMTLNMSAASAETIQQPVIVAMGTSAPVMEAQNALTEAEKRGMEEALRDVARIVSTDPAPEIKVPDYRVIITSDFGGSVIEYIKKYNSLRQSGSKIMVDDVCISACTLITGLIPDANVCVSPTAVFAFHSAWSGYGTYSSEGTRLIWQIYPEAIKEKLRALGWDGNEHPDLVYIKGTDLYRPCN